MSRTKVKKKGDGRMSGDEKLIIVALVQPRGVKQKRKKMAAALQPVQKPTNSVWLKEGFCHSWIDDGIIRRNATRTKPDPPKPQRDMKKIAQRCRQPDVTERRKATHGYR